jgi:hypothetical protein
MNEHKQQKDCTESVSVRLTQEQVQSFLDRKTSLNDVLDWIRKHPEEGAAEIFATISMDFMEPMMSSDTEVARNIGGCLSHIPEAEMKDVNILFRSLQGFVGLYDDYNKESSLIPH